MRTAAARCQRSARRSWAGAASPAAAAAAGARRPTERPLFHHARPSMPPATPTATSPANPSSAEPRRGPSASPSSRAFATAKVPDHLYYYPESQRIQEWTKNPALQAWIRDWASRCSPQRVELIDGSKAQMDALIRLMVQTGMLTALNPEVRPNSYLARSPAIDTARRDALICSDSDLDAGPTNMWKDQFETTEKLEQLFTGSMRGRTMYVIPFSMGPVGSPFSIAGVQLTDSPYVVASMNIMTRIGQPVLDSIGEDGVFIPCVHSVGTPLDKPADEDSPWPCNTEQLIVHFPEQRRIWSYGSGYGGNALLGKKCLALRIASAMGRDEGWLAEHMLIVGVTNPAGKKKYFAAAFPSACGKTNLAMMQASMPGWKVECVGDDIAWLHKGPNGEVRAINPESGFFGVAPGTSMKTNANAMRSMEKNTIFTNCGLKYDGDVYWEDMDDAPPSTLINWNRREWYPGCGMRIAHPNARFCSPASQCPVIDPDWENPEGVPISGFIFGTRRSQTIPLVYQARNWEHGVFVGSAMHSEPTAAQYTAAGKRGALRSDPFAMAPFCGYNMADYFDHWLNFGKGIEEASASAEAAGQSGAQTPRMFHVNWFRKDKNKFLWPGFGDNIRVIEWIFNRCDQAEEPKAGYAVDSPLGFLPDIDNGAISLEGLEDEVSAEDMKRLVEINLPEWRSEMKKVAEFYSKFDGRIPASLQKQLKDITAAVSSPPQQPHQH